MNNVHRIALKLPMIKKNSLSYGHQIVKTIHKMFPLQESVAKSSLSFLLPSQPSELGMGTFVHKVGE